MSVESLESGLSLTLRKCNKKHKGSIIHSLSAFSLKILF